MKKTRATVLIIDDRVNMLKMMSNMLGDRFDVTTCSDGAEALETFRKNPTDLVVTDIRMPDLSGMDILRAIKKENENTEVILMTAYAEVAQAVEALKAGAYDYVIKPFEPDEMVLTMEKALERKGLRERTAILEEEVAEKFGFPNIVGQSEALQRAFELARKAIASDTTVILTGDSGTGKELFSRAIHYSGPRGKNRFVAINCAAIPRDLVESELFGHVRGAFSGATRDKPGLFEEADGGTLLLDEITELAFDMQAKINRVLEQHEVRRLGDVKDRPVDVRVIASSNQDFKVAMEEGRFRADLYFRLNVFPIHLPRLCEREGDVELLVGHFLREFTGEKVAQYTIEPEAMQLLVGYSWPGNVRELRNAIERAVALCEDKKIGADLFAFTRGDRSQEAAKVVADLPYREAMDRMSAEAQKQYLLTVLERCDGNVTKAAEHAGIERESFHRLMRKCGIRSEDVKSE